MNKNFFTGLFVGLGLLLIVAFRPVEVKPPVESQKWEYKALFLSLPTKAEAKREAEFNALGQQGWELVSSSEAYAYFKRALH